MFKRLIRFNLYFNKTLQYVNANYIYSIKNRRFSTDNQSVIDCNSIEDVLIKRLHMSNSKVKQLIARNTLVNEDVEKIIANLKVLKTYDISSYIIRDNLSVLKLDNAELKKKLKTLSKTNFKHMDHVVPFLLLSHATLVRFCFKILLEKNDIPHENRLYYFSEKFQVDPSELAKYFSKRMFMFTFNFQNINASVDMLLKKGVEPRHLLRDLWVILYSPELIEGKLDKLKASGKTKFMPWLIRCQEYSFERSIDITMSTHKVLGDNKSVKTYLAERLNCNMETVEDMLIKCQFIKNMRVSKTKDMIDYLLSSGFKKHDIIAMPKVFAHSLTTVKQRLTYLHTIGIYPNSLHPLCKSAKDFRRYLNYMKMPFHKNKLKFCSAKEFLLPLVDQKSKDLFGES